MPGLFGNGFNNVFGFDDDNDGNDFPDDLDELREQWEDINQQRQNLRQRHQRARQQRMREEMNERLNEILNGGDDDEDEDEDLGGVAERGVDEFADPEPFDVDDAQNAMEPEPQHEAVADEPEPANAQPGYVEWNEPQGYTHTYRCGSMMNSEYEKDKKKLDI